MPLFYRNYQNQSKGHRLDTGSQSGPSVMVDTSKGKLNVLVDNQASDHFVGQAIIHINGQDRQCSYFWDNRKGQQDLFIRIEDGITDSGSLLKFSNQGASDNVSGNPGVTYRSYTANEWIKPESHDVYRLKATATLLEQEFYPGQKSFFERDYERKQALAAAAQKQPEPIPQPMPQPQSKQETASQVKTQPPQSAEVKVQPTASAQPTATNKTVQEAHQTFRNNVTNPRRFIQTLAHLQNQKNPERRREARLLYTGLMLHLKTINHNIDVIQGYLKDVQQRQANARTPAELDKLKPEIAYYRDQLNKQMEKLVSREIRDNSSGFLKNQKLYKAAAEIDNQVTRIQSNARSVDTNLKHMEREQAIKFRPNPDPHNKEVARKIKH